MNSLPDGETQQKERQRARGRTPPWDSGDKARQSSRRMDAGRKVSYRRVRIMFLNNQPMRGAPGSPVGPGRRTPRQTVASKSPRRPPGARPPGRGTKTPTTSATPGSGRRTIELPKDFHLLFLVYTAIVGAVLWIPCRFLYEALLDTMARSLLMGLVFALFSLCLSLAVFAFSQRAGTFQNDWFGSGLPGVLAQSLLITCAVFLSGAAFQFFYSIDFHTAVAEPSSYVFLIDDSGSMEGNDPGGDRFRAVPRVVEERPDGFPYAVYTFATSVQRTREMLPRSEETGPLRGESDGLTSVRTVLETVIHDFETGDLSGGANPKVVLLTDGYPTDFNTDDERDLTDPRFLQGQLAEILRRYRRAGICISAVGLGDGFNEVLLEYIASSTGGVYVSISRISGIYDAMKEASHSFADRDLVTTRFLNTNTWYLTVWYGFLRVLFLCILAFLLGIGVLYAYGQPREFGGRIGWFLLPAVVGAVQMELLTSVFHVSDRPVWLILWILLAMTPLWERLNRYDRRQSVLAPPKMGWIESVMSVLSGGSRRQGKRNQDLPEGRYSSPEKKNQDLPEGRYSGPQP